MNKTPARTRKGLGVKVTGTAQEQTVTMDSDDALEKIFGTDIPEMANALVGHCLKVLPDSEASDENPSNDQRQFMLSAVVEIKPRDTVERMLAVQMAATHVALVRSARWLANAETIEQVKAHYGGYTKLCRTFTAQTEALRKHRNGGNQTVTVQHVNVADGGQAIVGNVRSGGAGSEEK